MIPAGILGSGFVLPAGGGDYNSEVLADSPEFYYPLGDASSPAVDETGNTTASSGAWPTFGATGIGDEATCADFASSEVDVDAGSIVNAVSGEITVEALIYKDTLSGDDNICSRDLGGTNREYQFRTSGTKLSLAQIGGSNVTGATTLSTATIYHVAMTRVSGGDAILYVNGSEDASASTSGSFGNGTDPTYNIGYSQLSGGRDWFDGRIAGVAVYSSALSAARILAHAEAAGVA